MNKAILIGTGAGIATIGGFILKKVKNKASWKPWKKSFYTNESAA